jgi:hypothetical protein
VVAPRNHNVRPFFPNLAPEPDLYESIIRQIQVFRGTVYVEDEAIPASDLDPEGRHFSPFDHDAWHLFTLDKEMCIKSCLRLIPYTGRVALDQFRFSETIARIEAPARNAYEGAVSEHVDRALAANLGLAESGGWAIHKELRTSSKALVLAAAAWSLGRLLGNYLGLSTSTVRHHTVDMLLRLGAFPLSYQGVELPAFYDPYHKCEMRLLGFDTRKPAADLEQTVRDIEGFLRNALVFVP